MLKVSLLFSFMLVGSSIKAQSESVSCGISRVKSDASIESGGDFSRGTWPWMVAILEKTETSYKYFCTGTFILENKVLTGKIYQFNEYLIAITQRLLTQRLTAYSQNYSLSQRACETSSWSSEPSTSTSHPNRNLIL